MRQMSPMGQKAICSRSVRAARRVPGERPPTILNLQVQGSGAVQRDGRAAYRSLNTVCGVKRAPALPTQGHGLTKLRD